MRRDVCCCTILLPVPGIECDMPVRIRGDPNLPVGSTVIPTALGLHEPVEVLAISWCSAQGAQLFPEALSTTGTQTPHIDCVHRGRTTCASDDLGSH